ncbi:hypothetical protein ABZ505_31515, partial [Nocardia niwae]
CVCLAARTSPGGLRYVSPTRRHQRPWSVQLAGTKLKEFACVSSVNHLVNEARKPGSHHWPKDGKYRPQLLQAQRGGAPVVAEPAT